MTGSGAPEIGRPAARRPGSVAGAAGAVSAATMISRVLGQIREMVMAKYFGAGLYTDAFNIAYRIPNLLRDLFAEGALSSAFVPAFIRILSQQGKEQAWILANRVMSALLAVLGVVTLVIYFGARGFVYLLAAGYSDIPQKIELTVEMTRIMSPFLLFVALAAVAMGMLNAFGSYFVPALAPSAFNLCCILAGIFLSPFMPRLGLAPVVSMAIGAAVGGASQFLVQVPAARRLGFKLRIDLSFSDPNLRQIGRLMLPAMVGLSATQINVAVDSQLASMFGNGPVSWLNYAFRLMQLPIGIFGVAIATATLARVSLHAAEGNLGRLRETVASSLRLAACLTFPASVGLILFRAEIVRLIYERDRFLPSDTDQTSRALCLYAFALFAYSSVKILVPVFYALRDTRTPVRISVTTVAAKIAVNLLLIRIMGYLGLALATALASWCSFALLLRNLNRRIEARWGLAEAAAYLRIGAASALMGVIAWLAFRAAGWLLPVGRTSGLAFSLGTGILAGVASLVPLLRIFGIGDLNEVAGALLRRFRGGD